MRGGLWRGLYALNKKMRIFVEYLGGESNSEANVINEFLYLELDRVLIA